MTTVHWIFFCGWLSLLGGCRSANSTAAIPAVSPFELDRYLGVWHEAARMPRWFERGMERVTAEYSAGPDGSILVVNREIIPLAGCRRSALHRDHCGKNGQEQECRFFLIVLYAPTLRIRIRS